MKHSFGTTSSLRRNLALLVLFSLIAGFLLMTFEAGLSQTPWSTKDSKGGTMEFNDRFSKEHYLIILGNCSLRNTLDSLRPYDWGFIAAHLVGLFFLFRAHLNKWIIGFFFIQPIAFFIGFLGFLAIPSYIVGVINETNDRESFIDIPFVPVTVHTIWIMAAIIIGCSLLRPLKNAAP